MDAAEDKSDRGLQSDQSIKQDEIATQKKLDKKICPESNLKKISVDQGQGDVSGEFSNAIPLSEISIENGDTTTVISNPNGQFTFNATDSVTLAKLPQNSQPMNLSLTFP